MGIPIPEFCALVDIVTKRYGTGVMVSPQDGEGKMHLTLGGEHLGHIDINTGSLVWNKGQM